MFFSITIDFKLELQRNDVIFFLRSMALYNIACPKLSQYQWLGRFEKFYYEPNSNPNCINANTSASFVKSLAVGSPKA